MRRMFLDGCFILHFIHLLLKGRPMICLRVALILINKILISFSILNALMRIPSPLELDWESISTFISLFFLDPHEFYTRQISCFRVPIFIFNELFSQDLEYVLYREDIDNRHHLLHVLHYLLVGSNDTSSSSRERSDWYYYFFSSNQGAQSNRRTGKEKQFWGIEKC